MESKIGNPILNELGVTEEEARQVGLRLQEKRTQNTANSLADISRKLRISQSALEMIENGDWELLPQGANGRGFVRLYAKELGVALPEFEKFFDTQKFVNASQMQSNLSKIVEYARAKRFDHMNSYQKHMTNISSTFQKIFQSKKTTPFVPVSNENSSKNEQISPGQLNQTAHTKKWLLYSSLGVFVCGTGTTAYILSENGSINSEITGQPINESSGTNDTAQSEVAQVDAAQSEVSQEVAQNTIDADSTSTHSESASKPSEVASKTSELVSKPSELASKPSELASKPSELASKPSELASKPSVPVVAVVPVVAEQAPAIAHEQATTAAPVIQTAEVSSQKMQIDILSPVAVRIETDGKPVVDGLTQPGTLSFEFQKNAVLIIQDSSKVKLSYAGWNHELLGAGTRKRTIVLNAKQFAEKK